MKHIAFAFVAFLMNVTADAQSTIGHTVCVASYNYTCHTTDRDGKPSDVSCRLALQVGQKVSCSMGYAEHADTLQRERLEESRHYIARCYQGYPDKKITAHEVMPFNRFVTTEDMGSIKWRLANESCTLLSFRCEKAVGRYHGREWTVWFAPDIPSSAGPWRLHGLPGLILKAESDGIHSFECFSIDFVREPIVLRQCDGIKARHDKFVRHRNKKLCSDRCLSDPGSLIPLSEVENVVVMSGTVMLNGIPMMDTRTKYLPLELE